MTWHEQNKSGSQELADPVGSAGFGLIGVLVVVVILGLMGAGAILVVNTESAMPRTDGLGSPVASTMPTGQPTGHPSPTSVTDPAAIAACRALVAEIQTAISVYSAMHAGGNPSSLADLVPGLLKSDPLKGLRPGQVLKYDAASGTIKATC